MTRVIALALIFTIALGASGCAVIPAVVKVHCVVTKGVRHCVGRSQTPISPDQPIEVEIE